MFHLYCISHSIDIRNRCFHSVIHYNAAFDSQFKSRFPCKASIWGNANGQHYHIGTKRRFVLQQYLHAIIFFQESLHSISQHKPHAMLSHFAMNHSRHIRIKGPHKLFRTLDNSDVHSELAQILRQFQSDKTAACQYSIA